jgi:hypothetical protein
MPNFVIKTYIFMTTKLHKNLLVIIATALLPLLSFASTDANKKATRGIGVYPGRTSECFIPKQVVDNTYRNVALHRNATASSSFDFNLTPHLVTDGIIFNGKPSMLNITRFNGPVEKAERENTIDSNLYSNNVLKGDVTQLSYLWDNYVCHADSIYIIGYCVYREKDAKGGCLISAVSKDANNKGSIIGMLKSDSLIGTKRKYGEALDPDKQTEQEILPTREISQGLKLNNEKGFNHLDINLNQSGTLRWVIKEVMFFNHGVRMFDMLPSYRFSSVWMSKGCNDEWISVDLGHEATFNEVKINWIDKAAEGRIEYSNDGKTWQKAADLNGGKALTDNIKCSGKGRYVRLYMTKPLKEGSPYAISELQIMGRDGIKILPADEDKSTEKQLSLNGGDWKLQRSTEVSGNGETISKAGFNTAGWINATVPATVLMSYVNIGAVGNPNYDDDANQISESFFNSDFWYRRVFNVTNIVPGRHYVLCFDGINWKADVFVNGQKAGRIEGAFMRGNIDVTSLLKQGSNTLAVRIVHNAHYGAVKQKTAQTTGFNGGVLGADNPTFHATIGWDWITTVRGRDMGIWNDVYLKQEGAVTVSDPLVTTKLAEQDTTATITPTVVLKNSENKAVSGTLKGWIGNITFEKKVTVDADKAMEVKFSQDDFAQLKDQNMHLWWPNGYGAPYLYDAGYTFTADGSEPETITYKAGLREISYSGLFTKLQLYVNHRRVVPLGGNWGFPESNLSYRAREYETAVNYHRQMNFNMIRDWVGQTGDEEFYESCDRNGIMVWQDFWLANPVDGPNPDDEKMFLDNANDYVQRIRNHASVVLYCGRNEGYPPETINKELRVLVEKLHPTLPYFPSSADDGVSGHGPYRAMTPEYYFSHQSGKLHSERGMPNVMNIESLNRTLSTEHLWPQSEYWGRHDYTLKGAQAGASFNEIISTAFGEPQSAEEFTRLAQWENYDGYRAMYESGSKDRQGLLIWMSHPCWPSMVWQTYDYYFEPTAAFFGCKKACEPLHIQLNAATDTVEVVNMAGGEKHNLRATAKVYDMTGKMLTECSQNVDSKEDTTLKILNLHDDMAQAGAVYYVRLLLNDADGKLISENFYIRSNDKGSLKALRSLPKPNLQTTVNTQNESAKVNIKNNGEAPALMIRLNLKDGDGGQILPVTYSDNYFTLLPGESRDINVSWKSEDERAGNVKVEVTTLLK